MRPEWPIIVQKLGLQGAVTVPNVTTRLACAIALLIAAATPPTASLASDCAKPDAALGVDRVVEIDAANGPLFGEISVYEREAPLLAPKEVILTFDDGPMPWITKSILDTLDTFCTKATFFSVGRMALAYPKSVKDVLARGHTLGSHTWSHPLNIARLSHDKAIDQIERGIAAVALAAGQPIAPFFRFPGLSDSNTLLAHLQTRGIATFTVDVVSNDSFIGDAKRLTRLTLAEVDRLNGGIVLFHDIKSATAKALPDILAGLKAGGYKVVHMRAKAPVQPLADFDDNLKPVLEKAAIEDDSGAVQHALPFFGEPAVLKSLAGDTVEVTAVAPLARTRPDTGRPSRSKRKRAADDVSTIFIEPAATPAAKVAGWRSGSKRTKVAEPGVPAPFSLHGID